jgi:hypothetical protein
MVRAAGPIKAADLRQSLPQLQPESDARRCRVAYQRSWHQRSGMIMTEQDLHLESERLIEEARLEIEAIKEALEASREKPALVADVTESSHDTSLARTN